MNEKILNPEPLERSMTDEETLAFLREQGVKPVTLEDWKPHQSVLWVVDERIKGGMGPYAKLPLDKRPSIVRIDDPINLININDYDYKLENEGGQIDYYAINPKSKQLTLVKSTSKVRTGSSAYSVTLDRLFQAQDNLFPKSESNEK